MKKPIALAEVLLVFLLIFAQIWITGTKNPIPSLVAFAVVLCGWAMRKEGPAKIGLVSWPLAIVFVSIFLLRISGFGIGELSGFQKEIVNLVKYYSWAVFQQWILNGFFSLRLKDICGDDKRASLWAGTIFAALHLPNPLLTIITFAGGIAASRIFLKMNRRNVYVLALGHIAVGLLIKYCLPHFVHKNLVVGPQFFCK